MTVPSTPPEDANLLKAVLPPLLNDFQHWFARTISLLESQTITFLSAAEQTDLRDRIQVAQKQVSASQALASVTDGQAGIEMPVVMGWHKLVHECWGVALRQRKESQKKESQSKESQTEKNAAAGTSPPEKVSEQPAEKIPPSSRLEDY
ncbi:MAG: DUF2605 domain-containing protein [Phormidesmis sp.]